MRVIIAGSRDIENYQIVLNAVEMAELESNITITEVVSGGARGVDKLGELIAKNNYIPVKVFRAEWDKYGKSAGYRRNVEMSEYADAVIAVWDGSSKGTRHMIDIMKKKNKVVYVYRVFKQ